MLRKTLTILSLLGLLLSVGLFLNIPISDIVTLSALFLLVTLGRDWISRWNNRRDEIRKAKESGELCASCGYNMAG